METTNGRSGLVCVEIARARTRRRARTGVASTSFRDARGRRGTDDDPDAADDDARRRGDDATDAENADDVDARARAGDPARGVRGNGERGGRATDEGARVKARARRRGARARANATANERER
jgi:hypothetical protein